MSQQEFDPEFSAQEHDASQDEEYYPHAPYSWSGKLDSEATPRDVPPSSYGERPGSFNTGNQQASADGDSYTYQHGYGPYSSYNAQGSPGGQAQGAGPTDTGTGGQGQSVPPWARPQQHRRRPFRLGFIILALVIIVLIQGLIANGGIFVGAAGDILGAAFGLILFILIVPLIILVVFFGLAVRMFRSGGFGSSGNFRHRQRWRSRSWPNGPFWW